MMRTVTMIVMMMMMMKMVKMMMMMMMTESKAKTFKWTEGRQERDESNFEKEEN